MTFWDDLLGRTAADASNRAASDTYGKQAAAGNEMRQAGQTAYGQYNTAGAAYDPYANAGQSALGRLLAGLNLPGGTGGSAEFTNAYRATPGYQGGLDTGTNAVLRGINASGMSNSGAALKALQRFGSNYEDQRVGDYFGRLGGVVGQGIGATGARAGLQGQGIGALYGSNMGAASGDYNAAGTVGQGMVAGEQAKSDALNNLLKSGTYLGGTLLGGGGGNSLMSGISNLWGGNSGSGYGNTRGQWNPNVPSGILR